MDQFSNTITTTTTTNPSSPPPHLPLFLDSLPFLSPSSLLPVDPSHPLLPPAPATATIPPPPRASKKRSRASRRAPTTVLTTDTSNFRAMVQEFTGIPSPPFSLPPQPHLNFHPPFLARPFSLKQHPTSTAPNTFLQSLVNAPPVIAAKPTYPSLPPSFSLMGREELQQSQQSASLLLDSWICSSDYK